jgi:rhamnose transport system ATP-binding protein
VQLSVRHLAKSFAGIRALRDASIDVRGGEVHALIGENGAGKSTLVNLLTGSLTPDAGTIAIDGEVVRLTSPVDARRLGLVAIHQHPALFPDLTVAENLSIGLDASRPWSRVDWQARRSRAADLLARIGASLDVDREVAALSLPEQQLVEIARALGTEARLLILDEPTASLTPREVDRLFELLAGLKTGGTAIVYITHRLEELPRVADRVTVLRDGSSIATRGLDDVDRATLIRLMVGRDLASVFPKPEVTRGEPILELAGLGSRAAGVRDVTLTIHRGEIFGLAGLVGAGRTELARVLFGLVAADAGEIRIDGRPVTVRTPGEAMAHGIAYLPEDRRRHGVVLDLPVSTNLTLTALSAVSRRGLIDSRREGALARDLITALDVRPPLPDMIVRQLSGGNQQKVALGRWLAITPSVLILDEPTQGVDVGAKSEIHRLIGELAGRGLAVLMISSELPEVLGMSDRVGVMRAGSLVATFERSEATAERVMAVAFGSAPAA